MIKTLQCHHKCALNQCKEKLNEATSDIGVPVLSQNLNKTFKFSPEIKRLICPIRGIFKMGGSINPKENMVRLYSYLHK